jgi:hypothetical protein
MAKLERTTFETSRASEYFDARQLSTLTGMPENEFAGVCLKELVDNALDACETVGLAPEVGVEVEMNSEHIQLTVSDNGPGIPLEVVHKVLDYSIRVSDKAAYRSPTRGAQGNALKTVIGIPYALGGEEPRIVMARGVRHSIKPWVDPAGGVHFEYGSTREVTEGTTISLAIPNGRIENYSMPYVVAENAVLRDANNRVIQDFDPVHWCRSFAAFNPHATVSYRVTARVQKSTKFTNRPSKAR